MIKESYKCIGTMSGTSLDGLDIALCEFSLINGNTGFRVVSAKTYPYSKTWKEKLTTAEHLSGLALSFLNNELGRYFGSKINEFLSETQVPVDFIASHGHTVFHQPEKQLTLQIGSGAEIAATTGITTICDFRTMDVALNGQGAPLVPIGDKLLFSEYTYCLNLGGFANISCDNTNGERVAFDICPVNIIINHLVNERGLQYDKDGELAKRGNINAGLLQNLNLIPFYNIKGPKSLGKEWLINVFLPIADQYNIPLEDKLRTIYEHIAIQVQQASQSKQQGTILLTGGGAYNKFLVELIGQKTYNQVIIPENNIIDFKEALIFAFLGLLRLLNSTNCLKSVTGATKDSIGGAIFAGQSAIKN